MKTRGKGPIKPTEEAEIVADTITLKTQLLPATGKPPQLFLFPKESSQEARIVSLTNPKTSAKTRYFVCPQNGFYEFTKVGAPISTPRSWLLAPPTSEAPSETCAESIPDLGAVSKGYITSTAELFIATSIDPLFLVLPTLSPPVTRNSDSTKRLFLSGDDHVDQMVSQSPQLQTLLRVGSLREKLEARMASVCDTVEAGDEFMYRLSEEKLLKELLEKASKIVEHGLPPSMEEKFVRKGLEVPMLSIKREDSSFHELADEEDAINKSDSESIVERSDTQNTALSEDSTAISFSEASTAATSFSDQSLSKAAITKPTTTLPPINAPANIIQLLRLRTALMFILSAYIPAHIVETLKALLASSATAIDFKPLDEHLAHLAKLRQGALAARSLGDFSKKHTLDEEVESGESRAEKKRKKEEEEKKIKANQSRGVRDLKKVNVSGMKKMTSFFTKKA